MTKTNAEIDRRTADVLDRMDRNANEIQRLIDEIREDIRKEREARRADA